MPYPTWLAKINKRVFNPREIRRGERPVVLHVGRSSGTPYQTPLDAHPTKRGYLLVVRYGPGSDWVRNILMAGTLLQGRALLADEPLERKTSETGRSSVISDMGDCVPELLRSQSQCRSLRSLNAKRYSAAIA
jgi:hypothetical protein